LSVLRLLAGAPRGLALAEISHQLGMPLASSHRVLGVLESERFTSRSPTNRRYFLGPAARELGRIDLARESPLVAAHEAVARAGRSSGESVFLCELTGNRVVCVAMAESAHPLRLYVHVGQQLPLHAAAAARVLLAARPRSEARALLIAAAPLTAFTEETPTTVEEVLARLDGITERGYDTCDSELDRNVWAVSVPVHSSTGEVVASVTLGAPGHRMSDDAQRTAAREIVADAAAEMGADLGWSG